MADITVIGGINIDIEGAPRDVLRRADSNPGEISISFGGVGRNITENVARLGGDVKMISLTGDDFLGNNARDYLERLGVDVSGIEHVSGYKTGIYLSILDEKNDMDVGICNMDILEQVTPAFLESRIGCLAQSKIAAVDCNFSSETLAYIADHGSVPLFLDPVSASKAIRAKSLIGKFHTIKPNLIEAELLCNMKIKDEADLARAGAYFCAQGVKRVFISLGAKGAYYKDENSEGIVPTGAVNLVSATGAGDAFSAAILMGYIKGLSAEETAQLGIACASIAMEAQIAVNPSMSMEEAKKRMKK